MFVYYHPQEVLLARFSLYNMCTKVAKSPIHFISFSFVCLWFCRFIKYEQKIRTVYWFFWNDRIYRKYSQTCTRKILTVFLNDVTVSRVSPVNNNNYLLWHFIWVKQTNKMMTRNSLTRGNLWDNVTGYFSATDLTRDVVITPG